MSKLQEMVKDRGAWCGPVRGVPESRTRLRDRTGTRVDKTLCFQCRGWEFDVWLGKIPRAWWHGGRLYLGFPAGVVVKNLPAMQDTWVWSLCWEDLLGKGVATHSGILAWRIPTDRGDWWGTGPGVAERRTRLSNFHFHCFTSRN